LTTRSTKLFAAVVTGTRSVFVWRAPYDHVTLLKSLYGHIEPQQSTTIRVYVHSSTSNVDIDLYLSTVSVPTPIKVEGWIALLGADEVYADAPNATVHLWGSGAELPLP
jgi:hypothetical protein